MAKEAKFETVYAEYEVLRGELRKACMSWLKKQLKKHVRFDFTDMGHQIMCNFDGGDDPEFASTCFSFVNGVFIDNGKVYVDLEDCEDYEINKLTTDELYTLCDYVKNIYLPSLNKK